MSTLKTNITAKRLALVANQKFSLFHFKDFANLWSITNANSLRRLLKRYCDSGVLYRVQRGLYSLISPEKIEPDVLGAKVLHRYCYLTMEWILYREGYISQHSYYYTYASDLSKHFELYGHLFLSRQLNPQFLMNDAGIIRTSVGILEATLERAIADMLYYNPHFYFDRDIDWVKVRAMQEKIGYPLTPYRYDSPQAK